MPVILALGHKTPGLARRLLFVQGGMLGAHWLIKGLFERFVPGESVDPSGHMRVAMNTAVYIGWVASAERRLLPLSAASGFACFAWMTAQTVSVFQSAMLHHSFLDMVLGGVLAFPQLLLLEASGPPKGRSSNSFADTDSVTPQYYLLQTLLLSPLFPFSVGGFLLFCFRGSLSFVLLSSGSSPSCGILLSTCLARPLKRQWVVYSYSWREKGRCLLSPCFRFCFLSPFFFAPFSWSSPPLYPSSTIIIINHL